MARIGIWVFVPNAEHPALNQSFNAWKAVSVYANRADWMASYQTTSDELGFSKAELEEIKKEFNSTALKLSVYTLPTIIFFEELPNNQVRTITRIKGNTSYNQIYSVYQALLTEFSRLPASDPNSTRLPERSPIQGKPDNTAVQPTGSGNGAGLLPFGLFSIPIGLPPILWAVAGALLAMKVLSKNTSTTGKIAYGAGAVICFGNYLNQTKIPVNTNALITGK